MNLDMRPDPIQTWSFKCAVCRYDPPPHLVPDASHLTIEKVISFRQPVVRNVLIDHVRGGYIPHGGVIHHSRGFIRYREGVTYSFKIIKSEGGGGLYTT